MKSGPVFLQIIREIDALNQYKTVMWSFLLFQMVNEHYVLGSSEYRGKNFLADCNDVAKTHQRLCNVEKTYLSFD